MYLPHHMEHLSLTPETHSEREGLPKTCPLASLHMYPIYKDVCKYMHAHTNTHTYTPQKDQASKQTNMN